MLYMTCCDVSWEPWRTFSEMNSAKIGRFQRLATFSLIVTNWHQSLEPQQDSPPGAAEDIKFHPKKCCVQLLTVHLEIYSLHFQFLSESSVFRARLPENADAIEVISGGIQYELVRHLGCPNEFNQGWPRRWSKYLCNLAHVTWGHGGIKQQ